MPKPMLHLVCGKIAAGKSTLVAQLGREHGAVVVSEDEWLAALFGEEMKTGADFLRFSAKLRSAMGPHVEKLLTAGVTVVLDFAANTVEQRQWMRGLIDASDADHQLHFLDTSDALCLRRLRARNADGNHPFVVTEEQFHAFSNHFVAPSPDEGFEIVTHSTA